LVRREAVVIVKRGGKFAVSVYDPSLKRKRWVGTFDKEREAKAAEREASRRRLTGGRLTRSAIPSRSASRNPVSCSYSLVELSPSCTRSISFTV
jgi:hypothetical protein